MRLAKLLLAAVLLAPGASRAIDLPHDVPYTQSNTCYSCHKPHGATGPGLTTDPSNSNLCLTCHASKGGTWVNNWRVSDQATPGSGGHSHHWDSSTTNGAFGATPPTTSALALRTPNGNLMCSTCHDQHGAAQATNAPQNPHLSAPLKTGAGTVTMTAAIAAGVPVAQGYRIRVSAAGAFQVSHDAILGASPGTWGAAYAGVGTAPVSLSQAGDDPLVSVTFGAAPAAADVGAYWDFWVGYPFPRMAVGEAELCVDCHAVRNQTAATVEGTSGYGWASGKAYSHPVGQAMNANGHGYDFAAPLDAGGQTAPANDGNPSNDLVLSPTSKVTCLTCHAIHNTDSNSQTIDLH